MAVCWYAVNLDRCEAVDPQRMGEPATWAGWVNDGPEGTDPSETFSYGLVSLTRRWVHKLIAFGHWKYEDEIRLVSTEPEEGPASSVAWLGRKTDRVADYIGPEYEDDEGGHGVLWNDAPHPSTLKAPAPTLVPADEEPLVMPADEPEDERGMLGVPMVGEHSPPQRLRSQYDDEPPASVEELLASHPGPWRIESADAHWLRVVDPLGQVVAVMLGRYLPAAQLLVDVRASGSAVDLLTSGGGR